MAVAFLKQKGLGHLVAGLEKLLNQKGALTLVAGTDFWLTEPAALRTLFSLQRRHPDFRLQVFDQKTGATFHPKYYRFTVRENVNVLVGSANLTEGGMTTNIEVSLLRQEPTGGDLAKEAEDFERSVLQHPRCHPITGEWLAKYEVEHAIQKKERGKAERAARKSMKKIAPIAASELESLLASYLKSEKEQREFAQRKANYRVADRLLRQKLAGRATLNRTDFGEYFERLVGRTGEKLWHSGSLFRKKRFLIDEHVEMQAMMRDILAHLHLPPAEMYRRGETWMGKIKHLGPNIFTEICNTLRPARFAVLNKNPVTSLQHLALGAFPDPGRFSAEGCDEFCKVMNDLRRRCGFADLGRTDHFLNYIYWIKRNQKKS